MALACPPGDTIAPRTQDFSVLSSPRAANGLVAIRQLRMRGYFEVGIYRPKTPSNVGTLWRSAYQLGAAGIFTVGHRYPAQGSDTPKAWKSVPLRHYDSLDALISVMPFGCELVGVEMGGRPLSGFCHPERAVYLLGAEDAGLPPEVMERCDRLVSLESVNTPSYNVAVAGSIVAYSRVFGHGRK